MSEIFIVYFIVLRCTHEYISKVLSSYFLKYIYKKCTQYLLKYFQNCQYLSTFSIKVLASSAAVKINKFIPMSFALKMAEKVTFYDRHMF